MGRMLTAIGVGIIVGMISAGLLVIGALAIAFANNPDPESEIICPEVDFTYAHEAQAWEEEERLYYCWYKDDPTLSPMGTEPRKIEFTPLPTPKGFVICPPGYPGPRDYPPDPPRADCWDIDDPTKTPLDPADW
jgi:hypothetical protein